MTTWRHSAPLFALFTLSYLARLPVLLNADAINSDVAVVGLQTMHLTHGEVSYFLWGSAYQSTADAIWALPFTLIMGATPLALVISALTAHTIATLLVYATLARRLSRWRAVIATLPLVFTTACIHTYALYPPRQVSITLAILALYLIDRGDESRRLLGIGAALVPLAILADPYAALFVPGLLLVLALTILRSSRRRRALLVSSVAMIGGAIPLIVAWMQPRASTDVGRLSTGMVSHNTEWLVRDCLPWAIGQKSFYPHQAMDFTEWNAPLWFRVIAWIGIAVLLGAYVFSLGFVFRRSESAALRGFAAMALLLTVTTVGVFLCSVMVSDIFSMRYLAVAILVLPFLFAPLTVHMGPERALAFFFPFFAMAQISGWVSHGPFVHGAFPVTTMAGVSERTLFHELEARNVRHAFADYWASYRLTFLADERILFAPLQQSQDRYPQHREAVNAAKDIAYVFDDTRSFEDRNAVLVSFKARYEVVGTFDSGVFHCAILRKK